MPKTLICLTLIVGNLTGASPQRIATASTSATPQNHQTGRLCIRTAEMLSITATITKPTVQALADAGVHLQISADAEVGGYVLRNEQNQIEARIPKTVMAKTPICAMPDRLEQAKNMPASYIASFEDALQYRKTHTWPVEPANLSNPTSTTILATYGPYNLVMFSDPDLRFDAAGNAVLGCGGNEYYRVNPKTGQVLPFSGCVEGSGIPGLPALSQLPN